MNNKANRPRREPEYLSTGEAARRLGYNQDYLTRLCQQGKIPAKKFLHNYRIRRADIERLIAEAEQGGEKEEET